MRLEQLKPHFISLLLTNNNLRLEKLEPQASKLISIIRRLEQLEPPSNNV
jgi:hypothetical protein